MKYLAFTIFLGLILSACREDDVCKESETIKTAYCQAIYIPVCGCNGKTYGNACYAESRGIMVYEDGACP